MKTLAIWLVITLLLSVYAAALFAVLHPHVSPAYKAFYIDHTSLDWNPARYPGSPEQGMISAVMGCPSGAIYSRSVRP